MIVRTVILAFAALGLIVAGATARTSDGLGRQAAADRPATLEAAPVLR